LQASEDGHAMAARDHLLVWAMGSSQRLTAGR